MQSGFLAGTGIGSSKSAMIFSNNVDPPQATVAKMEQISDDHVEGDTILQLDQMRRIQPTGGAADLAPLTTGDTTSNKTEDVHPQGDPLDITMTEVNIQDIISTPVEDAMTDVMNTSAEDATLEDISDSEVKNDYASIATVEMQETVGSVDQIYKKITAELQEFGGAPLINGQGTICKPLVLPEFEKILGISSNNEQLDKITGASENDVIIEEAVETRSKNITGRRPFNASRPGDTLNTSKRLRKSSVQCQVMLNLPMSLNRKNLMLQFQALTNSKMLSRQSLRTMLLRVEPMLCKIKYFKRIPRTQLKMAIGRNLLLYLLKISLSVVLER